MHCSLSDALFRNGFTLQLQQKLHIAHQLAIAVRALHIEKYIHRDMKSANILLSADCLQVRVCDLGIARPLCDVAGHHEYTANVGTVGYMAPEVNCSYMSYVRYDESADINCFGHIVLDMITRIPAYDESRHSERETAYRNPATNETALTTLALACIEREPRKRPHITTIVQELEDLMLATMPLSSSDSYDFS